MKYFLTRVAIPRTRAVSVRIITTLLGSRNFAKVSPRFGHLRAASPRALVALACVLRGTAFRAEVAFRVSRALASSIRYLHLIIYDIDEGSQSVAFQEEPTEQLRRALSCLCSRFCNRSPQFISEVHVNDSVGLGHLAFCCRCSVIKVHIAQCNTSCLTLNL